MQPRRDSIEDQSTRKVSEPSGFQWKSLRVGWVVAGGERSERELGLMRIDNGVIAWGKHGFTWEDRWEEAFVVEGAVDYNVGKVKSCDVDCGSAEDFVENGE